MSFAVYDLLDKAVGDELNKLNPLEIGREKTAQMANDAILHGAEHLFPPLKTAVDFASDTAKEAQERAMGFERKGEKATGFDSIRTGVKEKIDGMTDDMKRSIGIEKGEQYDVNKKLEDHLRKNGYNLSEKGYKITEEEQKLNESTMRRRQEMNLVNKHIEHVQKSTLGEPEKKIKIDMIKKIGERILKGDFDPHFEGMDFGELSAKQEKAYYDNILQRGPQIEQDDARVEKWKREGISERDRLLIRDRIEKAIEKKNPTNKDALITFFKNKDPIKTINNEGAFHIGDHGDLKYISTRGRVGKKLIEIPKETTDQIKQIRQIIVDSDQFSEPLKKQLDLNIGAKVTKTGAETTAKDVKSSFILNEPKDNYKPLSESNKTERDEMERIENLVSTDLEDDEFTVDQAFKRSDKETGFKRKSSGIERPKLLQEQEQRPGQEPEDIELSDLRQELEPPVQQILGDVGIEQPKPEKLNNRGIKLNETFEETKKRVNLKLNPDGTLKFPKTDVNLNFANNKIQRQALGDGKSSILSNLRKNKLNLTDGEKQLFEELNNELQSKIQKAKNLKAGTPDPLEAITKQNKEIRAEIERKERIREGEKPTTQTTTGSPFTEKDTTGLKEAIGGDEPKPSEIETFRKDPINEEQLNKDITNSREKYIKELIGEKGIVSKNSRTEIEDLANFHEKEFQKVFFPDIPPTGEQLTSEHPLFKKIMNTKEPLTAEDLNLTEEVEKSRAELDKPKTKPALDISAAQTPPDIPEVPEPGSEADIKSQVSDPSTFERRPIEPIKTVTDPPIAPTIEPELPKVPEVPETKEEGSSLSGKLGAGIGAAGAVIGTIGGVLAGKEAIEKEIKDLFKDIEGDPGAPDDLKERIKKIKDLQDRVKDAEDKIKEHNRVHGAPKEGAGPGDFQTTNQRKQLINQVQDLRNDMRNLNNAQSSRASNIQLINNPSTSQSDNNQARDRFNNAELNIKDLKGKLDSKSKRLLRSLSTFQRLRLNKLIQLQAMAQAKKEGDKQKEDRIRRGVLKAKKPVEVTVNIKNNNKPMNKIISKPVLTNTGGNIKIKNKPINKSKNINNINTG